MAIQLSNYGGERGYQKQEKNREWNDLLLMKKQNQKSLKSQDFVLVNQDYGTFLLDLEDYVLNTKTNQYIRENINEIYPSANRYEDDRYLRKYIRQQPNAKKEENLSQMRIANGSIFFTSCDDVEKSYHYKNDAE